MDQEQIVDAVRDWLDGDDWHYEYVADHHIIKMGVGLKSKLKNGRIFIDIKEDAYLVYIVSPIGGDKDDLGELMKFLTMANYGIVNGNFELDMRDGEVRYKTYVNCDGLEELSKEVIQDSVLAGCYTIDRYGNGIAALCMGFSDAETEIKKIEGDSESSEEGEGGDAD